MGGSVLLKGEYASKALLAKLMQDMTGNNQDKESILKKGKLHK